MKPLLPGHTFSKSTFCTDNDEWYTHIMLYLPQLPPCFQHTSIQNNCYSPGGRYCCARRASRGKLKYNVTVAVYLTCTPLTSVARGASANLAAALVDEWRLDEDYKASIDD